MDKIVSGYKVIYGSQVNEDAVFSKCKNAITCVEKVEKEIGGDIRSGIFFFSSLIFILYSIFLKYLPFFFFFYKVNGTGVTDELKGQHATLRDCIEQLTVIESSRTNLVSYLREALQDQVCWYPEIGVTYSHFFFFI